MLNCVYKTPCGWCSKWDKECDEKKYATKTYNYNEANDLLKTNKIQCEHEWECIGISAEGCEYRCKKCGETLNY